jgi:hypothetical protein
MATTQKTLTDGQRAYEEKRAARAGMSIDKWLASKQRDAEQEAAARARATAAPTPTKKPGLLGRLIERAHQPLKGGDAPKGRGRS